MRWECGVMALHPVVINRQTIAIAGSASAAQRFASAYRALCNGTEAGDANAWHMAAHELLEFGNMEETQTANDDLRPARVHSVFGAGGTEYRFR